MIKNDPQGMGVRRAIGIFIALFLIILGMSILSFVLPSSSGQRFVFPWFYHDISQQKAA